MLKWAAGLLSAIIAGLAVWYLTEALGPDRTQPAAQPPPAKFRLHRMTSLEDVTLLERFLGDHVGDRVRLDVNVSAVAEDLHRDYMMAAGGHGASVTLKRPAEGPSTLQLRFAPSQHCRISRDGSLNGIFEVSDYGHVGQEHYASHLACSP